MPTRSERMKQRWADPDQAKRLRQGLVNSHRAIADRLEAAVGGAPPPEEPDSGGGSGTPPPSPPDPSPGGAPRGGGIGSIFAASPRDLWDRITGGGSTK